MKATALFLAIHCVVAGMTKQLTDVETSSQSGANIYLPSRDLDKKSRNLKAGAESPNRRTRRILTTETASAATTPMANDIRTPETTETPPSTPAPTPTPTPASAATETRDYFVSVKVLVVVNVHDFDVSPMLAATTEEALQSNFENGLNKISDFEQRAGADIQLNRVMRTTTTRMLGELLKQKKVENSLHSNDDDPYSRLRENSSLSDGLPANTSTNILTDGATTETISRWLPCGYAPRRCQYPDSCVRADRGSPCKQFQLPRHSIKQFVDFWDSEYEDCRCLPNITGNLLNSASYSLPAYFGPNVGVGRLSAFYNFPKCSSTSLKIGNQRALSAAHCWCGVQFLICHPLQECWIKEDRPELSRCVLPPRGHHDYLTRWIGGRGFPLCSEEETLVNKNYFHLLCKCQSVAQIGDVTYCMRGQRCLRSPSDGPIGCQSVYAACVTNRTSTKDVCYCKERACAYKEICQIVNGTGHCIPDLSILCPQNYHSVLRTFIQCENGSVINAISDTCSNDEKIQWCPKDWPFLCNNRSTCVMHPEVCGDNGVHPCACANTTSVCESCTNEKKDNDEHAVDCGGRLCAPCDECFLFQNCSSNACPSTSVCEIDSHADCKDDCIDQCARNGCLRLQARGAKGVCMEECNIDACRLDHAVCSGYGCTDNTALNFNTIAVDDDGSCVFAPKCDDEEIGGASTRTCHSSCDLLHEKDSCNFFHDCEWNANVMFCHPTGRKLSTVSDALFTNIAAWSDGPNPVQRYYITTHFKVAATKSEANSCFGLDEVRYISAFDSAFLRRLANDVDARQDHEAGPTTSVLVARSVCTASLYDDWYRIFCVAVGFSLGTISALMLTFVMNWSSEVDCDVCVERDYEDAVSSQWRINVRFY